MINWWWVLYVCIKKNINYIKICYFCNVCLLNGCRLHLGVKMLKLKFLFYVYIYFGSFFSKNWTHSNKEKKIFWVTKEINLFFLSMFLIIGLKITKKLINY